MMRKYVIYDKLHRGFVITCMTATVVGLTFLGIGCYEILTKVRPQIAEKDKLVKEELLKEGREVIVDNIPTLKT